MNKTELMDRIIELDGKILSLLDPLEISRLILEREELLKLIPEVKLGLDEAYEILENNNKIMIHLRKIELDLKRRLGDLKGYSSIYSNYYISSYKLKENLVSEEI
ncbi:MAG: hypothetical protein N2380_05820 [bacterium]|nr:hypothetical protein [bacterium]